MSNYREIRLSTTDKVHLGTDRKKMLCGSHYRRQAAVRVKGEIEDLEAWVEKHKESVCRTCISTLPWPTKTDLPINVK